MKTVTITITLTDKQYERYAEAAKAKSKTLEQYISDKINGIPAGYTVNSEGISIHQPEADKIRAFIDEYTFEEVQKKLKASRDAKSPKD